MRRVQLGLLNLLGFRLLHPAWNIFVTQELTLLRIAARSRYVARLPTARS
jgi:hypothetical protein